PLRFTSFPYTTLFRSQVLGEVRCALVDVKPRDRSRNRGFMGRIWVEDQDFNIVRFTGTHSSQAAPRRAFHFDSWRLNTLSTMWIDRKSTRLNSSHLVI